MADMAFYARVVETCFPGVRVEAIEFLGGGSCRVFLVNGALVFRFPHGGPELDEALHRERVLYERIVGRLPVPAPRYIYFSEGCSQFPHPVAGYLRLAGVSMQDLVVPSAPSLPGQIGALLSALHRLPPAGHAGERDVEGMRALYGRIRGLAFPLLDTAERAWTEALFEPFLADTANWRYTPVFIHGDFDSSNILCDEASGDLRGVIDFEDAGMGDPASDFCVFLAEHGPAFVEGMLAAYTLSVDERFRSRLQFRARAVLFHELLYGLEYDAPAFAAHARKRLRRAMAGAPATGGWLPASTSATRALSAEE